MSNFNGHGYDKSPFSDEENAAHREMFRKVCENFITITPSQLKTLETLDTMIRAWPFYLAAAAAGVVLKQYGVI